MTSYDTASGLGTIQQPAGMAFLTRSAAQVLALHTAGVPRPQVPIRGLGSAAAVSPPLIGLPQLEPLGARSSPPAAHHANQERSAPYSTQQRPSKMTATAEHALMDALRLQHARAAVSHSVDITPQPTIGPSGNTESQSTKSHAKLQGMDTASVAQHPPPLPPTGSAESGPAVALPSMGGARRQRTPAALSSLPTRPVAGSAKVGHASVPVSQKGAGGSDSPPPRRPRQRGTHAPVRDCAPTPSTARFLSAAEEGRRVQAATALLATATPPSQLAAPPSHPAVQRSTARVPTLHRAVADETVVVGMGEQKPAHKPAAPPLSPPPGVSLCDASPWATTSGGRAQALHPPQPSGTFLGRRPQGGLSLQSAPAERPQAPSRSNASPPGLSRRPSLAAPAAAAHRSPTVSVPSTSRQQTHTQHHTEQHGPPGGVFGTVVVGATAAQPPPQSRTNPVDGGEQYTPGAGIARLQSNTAHQGAWERVVALRSPPPSAPVLAPPTALTHTQLQHYDPMACAQDFVGPEAPASPMGSTRRSHATGQSGHSAKSAPPTPGLLTPQQVDAARVLATQHAELSSELVAALRQEMVDAAYEEIMWDLTPPAMKLQGGRFSLGDFGPELRARASEAIQSKVAHGTMALQATVAFARALQEHWRS